MSKMYIIYMYHLFDHLKKKTVKNWNPLPHSQVTKSANQSTTQENCSKNKLEHEN